MWACSECCRAWFYPTNSYYKKFDSYSSLCLHWKPLYVKPSPYERQWQVIYSIVVPKDSETNITCSVMVYMAWQRWLCYYKCILQHGSSYSLSSLSSRSARDCDVAFINSRCADSTVSLLSHPSLVDLLMILMFLRSTVETIATSYTSTSGCLDVRPSRLVTVGNRSFATAALRFWNSLLSDFQSVSLQAHSF